jgi:hypothetical protein
MEPLAQWRSCGPRQRNHVDNGVGRRHGHFGQRFVDLLFRVIKVLEGIEETIVEVFLGHLVLGR